MRIEDQVFLAGVTVYMEAGAEPYLGKVAVASVIVNRTKADHSSLTDVIFRKFQFSCWNSGSPTLSRLDTAPEASLQECKDIVWNVLMGSIPDPTGGATHYLNESMTRAIRADGSLPEWFDESKVTNRIGKHTFLKL